MALALVSRGGGRGALVAVFGHLPWPFDPIRGGPGGSWDREAGTGKLGAGPGASCHGPRSTVHGPRSTVHPAHGSGAVSLGRGTRPTAGLR